MILKKKIAISTIVVIGLLANVVLMRAEMNDTTQVLPQAKRSGYRSFQFDVVTALFINGFSGSVDYDLKRVSQRTDIGLRGGGEFYSVNGISGGNNDSPYADLFLYFRSSTAGTHIQWDLYAGPAYHTSTNPMKNSIFTLKFGTDIRYYLLPHKFGIILKLNMGAAGIGITFGNGSDSQ